MANNSLMKKWQKLSPNTRKLTAIGGVVVIMAAYVFGTDDSKPKTVATAQEKKQSAPINLALPGSNGHDITIEKLTANIESLTRSQKELGTDVDRVKKTANEQKPDSTQSPETTKQLEAMRAEIADLKSKQSQGSLDDALPSPQTHNENAVIVPEAPQAPVIPELWSVGQPREQTKPDPQEDPQKKKKLVYLPAGSMFEGVLLNGMEAPTSSFAQKQPTPAVMRIKTDAILPNRYRYDVRECFVILSGYGVLSTERVNLQTVLISCVKNDGSVIEKKIEGFVSGEDGKVGMKGKLISRRGQYIAKSFSSGFFAGIAQSVQPSAVPQLNITPGSTTQYQTPNLGAMVSSGTAQGLSQTSKSISQFYLDMAKEMFETIEVGANRTATITLLTGVELTLMGEK